MHGCVNGRGACTYKRDLPHRGEGVRERRVPLHKREHAPGYLSVRERAQARARASARGCTRMHEHVLEHASVCSAFASACTAYASECTTFASACTAYASGCTAYASGCTACASGRALRLQQ
eukprot:6206408-Pleurochrysis_carterae.AAC.2